MSQFIVLTNNLEYTKVIEIMRQHDPESKVSFAANSIFISTADGSVSHVYTTVHNAEEQTWDFYDVRFTTLDWNLLEEDLCPHCQKDLSWQEEEVYSGCMLCGFTWGKFRGGTPRVKLWIEKNLG